MTIQPHHQTANDQIDILLVEDNPGDIRLIQEAFKLTDQEITLQTTANGSRAMNLLRQHATDDTLPDFVFLDMNLPGQDGCEILESIRNDSQLHRLPVIMLTSSEAEEDIARCYKSNANAYLTKPVTSDDFRSLVTAVEKFWFEKVELPPIPE